MSEEGRISEILDAIHKIQKSELPLTTYFDQNSVPFSRVQYYRYCKTLQKSGEDGLYDRRHDGNYTKLTERIKDYVMFIVNEDRTLSTPRLQNKILDQFDVKISESCLNNFRASISLKRLPAQKVDEYTRQKSSGGEILTCLAFFTGIVETYT
ncbi:MAG: helix-turn-helix domain-containing protein, partial [Methanoregula sp.]|nr:helix-turn-helix domain-containing protein [Methanoregula sp.]